MITKLISDGLASALIEQIGHEKYNSSVYLYLAGYLKNKGLDNLAGLFEKQHEEEFEHSKMVYGILVDLNAPVIIPEVDGCNMPIINILDIATIYLEREIITTESLDAIKKLAIEENNPVVEEFMRDMIKLQRNEYEEATTFYDKSELTGNDWRWVMNWDLSLG
jgi:ferritin